MNTSRFLLGAVLLCALPLHAQPEVRPTNDLPYPLVPVEEAIRLLQKPVSMHLQDVTLQDALGELSKQFNARLGGLSGINVAQALATKLSVDIQTTSFKEAFEKIIKAAGVSARLDQMPGNISINFGRTVGLNEEDTYLSGRPPFGIRLKDIQTSTFKTVILGKTPSRVQNNDFYIKLQEEVEPQLPVLGSGRLRVTRVEDELGRSLQVIEEPAALMGLPDVIRGSRTDIHLRPPEVGSKRLSRLEGFIVYVFPTKYEKWDIADVLNAENETHEFKNAVRSVKVTILNAQKLKTGLHLELEISSPLGGRLMNGGLFSTLSATQLVSAISLKDVNGQMPGAGGVRTQGTDDKVRVNLSYRLPEPDDNPLNKPFNGQDADAEQMELTGPISFSLNVPIEMAQTEVPFSFSDVPLP